MTGSHSHDAPTNLWRVIPALGIAQIIAWGSLYYSIAVLVVPIQADLHLNQVFIFGAFTVALVVSGLVAPVAGRLVDRHGGRLVLAVGSLLSAIALSLMALADGPVLFLVGWIVAGIAMGTCLYDVAFAALNQLAGARYRGALTALTLFGGFASTVFWPLSHWLLEWLDWRQTLWIYASLHLFICWPLHAFAVPKAIVEPRVAPTESMVQSTGTGAVKVEAGWLIAAFALSAFVFSALSVHLIQILREAGMQPADAILVSTLIGPMQVFGRIVELSLAKRISATAAGTASFLMMFVALIALCFASGPFAVAILFAALYGASNGVMTIIRGTVPAELFGTDNYGELLGRLARPTFIAKAVAPVVFALAVAAGLSQGGGAVGLAVCAGLAFLSYRRALSRSARAAVQPSAG